MSGLFNNTLFQSDPTGGGGGTSTTAGAIGSVVKNYMTLANLNTNFETNATTGWSLGNVAVTNGIPSSTSPTFGSGASGNLSIASVATSQLQGSYAMSYASSAATTAGNFVASSAFAVDGEDQGKILTIRFSYYVASGSYTFAGTNSDSLGVAIWDVTNSAWIMPLTTFPFNSLKGYTFAQFQLASNTASIRLVVYNANPTAAAATIYLDDFYVGPVLMTGYDVICSDPVAYTPTLAGFGSAAGLTFYYSRQGKMLTVWGQFGSGTTTATIASISLPTGLVIDSSIIPSASPFQIVGKGNTSSFGTTFFSGLSVIAGGGNSVVYLAPESSASSGLYALNASNFVSSGQVVSVYFQVPIQGWSSQSQIVSQYDGRVVGLSVIGNPTNAFSAGNCTPIWSSASTQFDTANAWNAGTGTYTIPVSGKYSINFSAQVGGTGSVAGSSLQLYIYKNGAAVLQSYGFSPAANFAASTTTVGSINCNAGDTITFFAICNETGPLWNGGSGTTHVDINLISGAQQILNGFNNWITRSVNSISTNTSAASTSQTDYVYLCTATLTLTLPNAIGNLNEYTIKNKSAGTITIATTSSQTIDGATTATISVQYSSITVYSDGSNWNIV